MLKPVEKPEAEATEAQLLQKVISVITGVTGEMSFSKIFRNIVLTAGEVTRSDGETLYLLDENSNALKAVVLHNEALGLERVYDNFDPVNMEGFVSLPLHHQDGSPNLTSISAHCALGQEIINLSDLDGDHSYDVSRVREFDKNNNYSTRSMLAIPLYGHGEEVIGVLQLINPNTGTPLSESQLDFARILASLLGAALSNAIYILSFDNLMASVIQMVGKAIDEKSPHTAGHCQRVTELALRLAKAFNVVKKDSGEELNKHDLRELEAAALLHDIGKIITPQHILDKSTKLQCVGDRIEVISEKFLLLKQQKEIGLLRKKLEKSGQKLTDDEEAELARNLEECKEQCDFLERVNTNRRFLDKDAKKLLERISELEVPDLDSKPRKLLGEMELYNLSIGRGTLNPEERKEMENHASITIRLLKSLPWPKELRNVTEYAGGHHENVNGSGYPNKLTGDQMSIPARMLSIVDRFEGLSAPDRPYKGAMPLSKVMKIMDAMHEDKELDEDLYRIFLERKVYLEYAKAHLPEELIDVN